MAFLRIGLWFALAVSVTLAITKVEDTPTITCQYIQYDKKFELDALEMRESDEISLTSCTIMTPSNYSDNVNKLHCHSCSLCEIGGWVRKSGVSKPHERIKRQDNAERPLYAAWRDRVLQTAHTYHLPCPVVAPDDVITDVQWFKGSSSNPKGRQLILQHYHPPGGTIILTPGYRFSDTNYGMIIESATQTDFDRYWCKAYKESIRKYVEDFLDVIVLGKTFPIHRWPNTVGDIQRMSLKFEEEKLITCPVMSQTGSRQDEVIVYWSRLSTEDGQSLDIVIPDIGDATAGGEYSLDANNNLVVNKFHEREEMYCCHVFQYGTDLRQGCVRVLWTAIHEQKYPVISGCGDVTSPEDQCNIKLESHQDFFQLECSVNSVYPRPEVSWSVTDCDGKSISAFSTCNDWAYDDVSMAYNATSKLYLHNLPSGSLSCNFICTSRGGAIANGVESSYVKLSRDEAPQSSCSCVGVFVLTIIFVTLLFLLVIGLCLRNRRFIEKHINEMPSDCLVKDEKESPWNKVTIKSENAQNSKIEREYEEDEGLGSGYMESTPMRSFESQRNDDHCKGPVCLIRRTTSRISLTDEKTHTWNSDGQLVTGSFILGDVSSGFKYIRDVIPAPTQDGGLVVIDSRGMHQFTSEFHYKFVGLYRYLTGVYLCVAYFATNKLLFGLIMGKIVIFDTDKTEVSTFSFIMPVGDKEVKLASLSVDSQGFVFAGDSNGKAISMFDPDGVCIKRVEINIEPNFLFAHINKKVDLFVSSETTVEMYSVDRKSCYPYTASMGAAKCIIDRETVGLGSFCSGGVVVRGDKLFVVNKLLQDYKNVQVLQHNEASGDEEHTFIVAVSDDEAATVTSHDIKGVVFIEEDKILVFSDDAVYILEKI